MRYTNTALHNIVRGIENFATIHGLKLATFLVIERAFNNINFIKIINVLELIDKDVTTYIGNIIKSRRVSTDLSEQYKAKVVN